MRPFLAILLAAAPAFADWEGRARFTFTPPRPGQGPLADGRIHMKRGKIRIEQKGPMGEMAIVFNLSTKKLDLLLLERKQYMELDQSMSAATVPERPQRASPLRASRGLAPRRWRAARRPSGNSSVTRPWGRSSRGFGSSTGRAS